MKRRALVVMVVSLLVAQPAWAMRTKAHEAAESSQYGQKFGGMIGRGVINVATCFVDLLVNIVNETRNGPPIVGTLVGVGKGAGCTVLRAGSGVVDVATFWVPGFNGFPVSDSYDNCVAVGGGSASSDAGMMPPGYPEGDSAWNEPATSAASAKEHKPRYSK
jgi:putative exosortase-associated protein (TIGR04073 family)